MEGSSIFTSAAVGDSKHELGDSEDALGEYKSPPKIHNPFRLYDNFRKGCTNVLANQRGLKGSNGFRNNGGHPNHHSQCYEVADAQASLASSSIQITSIKPRRLNSEADSSDSSNSADDITISQVIKVKSQKHRDSDSSNFSSSNEDNSYPQPIGDFSKEIFSSLDSTLGRDDSLSIAASNLSQTKIDSSDIQTGEKENQSKRRLTNHDGNTTDDSGVDSICCTLDTGDKFNGSNEAQNNHDIAPVNSSPPLRTSQNSKSASSFLQDIATYGYDTISKKRSSIWKREFNINGAGGATSDTYVGGGHKEECKNFDSKDHHTYANVNFNRGNSYSLVAENNSCNVELTSVVQNKSFLNINHNKDYSDLNVKTIVNNSTIRSSNRFNVKSDRAKCKGPPIYSSVNVATKKATKKKGKDSSVCRQISNAAISRLPVLKFLTEDIDIGENSYSDTSSNEKDVKNLPEVHPSVTNIGPKETEVTDLRELTKLLNSTSALLQRNSNLRASLTISVKNPRNGASNAQTFVLPSGRENKDTAKNIAPVEPSNQQVNLNATNDVEKSKTSTDSETTNSTSQVQNKNEPCDAYNEFSYKEVAIDCDFSATSQVRDNIQTKICDDKTNESGQVSNNDEDDQFVSLVNIEGDVDPTRPPAFVRHNPIRRPVVAAAMTTTNSSPTSSGGQKSATSMPTVCRRSIRLAPKTVANLANKFEACGLLEGHNSVKESNTKYSSNKGTSSRKSNGTGDRGSNHSSKMPDKELKLCKKDITKIIGTLNRLEEDAKRSCYRPRPMTTPGSTLKKNSTNKIGVNDRAGEKIFVNTRKQFKHMICCT